ncbi:MAG TPA: hypothetical protein VHV51_09125 [Polyangiaceae bacterium]|nr:hypothetical protein [Polyangiaceae bacterium]
MAAQSLFDDAKRLMAAKNYAEACPKFAESQRLDPAGGTLIALGLCNEAWGKTASAWAEFNDALTAARLDKRSDRERAALAHIAALEKRLIRLRVVVPADAPSDLRVERDGVAIGRAEWSTPIAIEPGLHHFSASAANRAPWSADLRFDQEGQTVDLKIPELAEQAQPNVSEAPAPAASAPLNASPVPAAPPPEPPKVAASSHSSQTTWAWLAGGTGAGLVVIGSIFGASAISNWNAADKACPGHVCTSSSDRDKGLQAGRAADFSTVFFAVGGAALVTSAVLFLTAPHSKSEDSVARRTRITPWVGVGSAGIGVSGAL